MPSQIDGKPILDSKKSLTLHITQSDINKSDPKRPETCAAANCIRRELHAEEVKVHLSRVYIRMNKGSWQRYYTSAPLRNEIIAFDRGGNFAAGKYELLSIRPSHKSGKRQGSKDVSKLGGIRHAGEKRRRKGPPRKSPHVVKDVRMGPA